MSAQVNHSFVARRLDQMPRAQEEVATSVCSHLLVIVSKIYLGGHCYTRAELTDRSFRLHFEGDLGKHDAALRWCREFKDVFMEEFWISIQHML